MKSILPATLILSLSFFGSCSSETSESTKGNQENLESSPVESAKAATSTEESPTEFPGFPEDNTTEMATETSEAPETDGTTTEIRETSSKDEAEIMEETPSASHDAAPEEPEEMSTPSTPTIVDVAKKEVVEEVKQKLDHSPFDALLKKYVTADGKVNYAGFKKEKAKLNAYCEHLSATPPESSWSRSEKLAYWINVYNAFTVQLIVDNHPTTSITKLYGGKPWDRRFVKVGAKTYTLSEVENKIIRPTFKEPRIHFAVNCASFSCPILLNEAYTAAKLESQLQSQTIKFVNDTKRNKLGAKSVQLSQIFQWYAEDFKPAGGALPYVQKYAKTEISDKAKVDYLEYDWNLND